MNKNENLSKTTDDLSNKEFLEEEEIGFVDAGNTDEEEEEDISFIGADDMITDNKTDPDLQECVDRALSEQFTSDDQEYDEPAADPVSSGKDTNKEEHRKKSSFLKNLFQKEDENTSTTIPEITGIDMSRADIVISKKASKGKETVKEKNIEPVAETHSENKEDPQEPLSLTAEEILANSTAVISNPTNTEAAEKAVDKSKEKKHTSKKEKKTLHKTICISVMLILVVLLVLIGLFFLFKKNPLSRIAREHSSSADVEMTDITVDEDMKSFISSGMYYNIQNGYSHALGEEELEAVRSVFESSNIIGSQISYDEYSAILESISSNSLNDLAFLILHQTDDSESIIILKAGDDLYFENESVPDSVWCLDKDNDNTATLSNIMMMLSKLQDIERQIN